MMNNKRIVLGIDERQNRRNLSVLLQNEDRCASDRTVNLEGIIRPAAAMEQPNRMRLRVE
jgi:hypothetical protein